jgi:hypothetical protein
VADLLVSTGSLGAAREVAVGVERGTRYELIGPDGARVVFNDRTDIDFVGFLTEVPSGIDSPEVRESADILVEADGGIHGSFYFGRRPFTLTGMIDPTPNVGRDTVVEAGITRLMQAGEVVNRRINRLQRATRAMTGDSLLRWQAANGPAVQVSGRRQQPLRIASSDPRILRQNVSTVSRGAVLATDTTSAVSAVSDGNAPAWPVITIRSTAAITGPIRLVNRATGGTVELALNLVNGDVVVVDFKAHTVLLNGTNRFDAVNFGGSTWWPILPGENPVIVTAGGGVTTTAGGAGGTTSTVTPIDAGTSIDAGTIIEAGGITTTTTTPGSDPSGNLTFEVAWRDAWL